MAERTRKDTYANMAYLACVESAAATLTFDQLTIATSSLLDKKYGLLINRADFEMFPFSTLNSDTDSFTVGITVSDSITDLALSRAEVIIRQGWQRTDFGVAASGALQLKPTVRDFSTMPGGGILVPADRLFIGVVGVGTATAITGVCRLYYTVVELSADDYWQLVESRRILST